MRGLPSTTRRDVAVLALPLVVYAACAAVLGSWVVDDAGISYAYARSVAGGHGFVSQPGRPPVEGFSSFLWVVLLVPTFWARVFDPVVTPKILGGLGALGAFAILQRTLRRATGSEVTGDGLRPGERALARPRRRALRSPRRAAAPVAPARGALVALPRDDAPRGRAPRIPGRARRPARPGAGRDHRQGPRPLPWRRRARGRVDPARDGRRDRRARRAEEAPPAPRRRRPARGCRESSRTSRSTTTGCASTASAPSRSRSRSSPRSARSPSSRPARGPPTAAPSRSRARRSPSRSRATASRASCASRRTRPPPTVTSSAGPGGSTRTPTSSRCPGAPCSSPTWARRSSSRGSPCTTSPASPSPTRSGPLKAGTPSWHFHHPELDDWVFDTLKPTFITTHKLWTMLASLEDDPPLRPATTSP